MAEGCHFFCPGSVQGCIGETHSPALFKMTSKAIRTSDVVCQTRHFNNRLIADCTDRPPSRSQSTSKLKFRGYLMCRMLLIVVNTVIGRDARAVTTSMAEQYWREGQQRVNHSSGGHATAEMDVSYAVTHADALKTLNRALLLYRFPSVPTILC